MPVQETRREAHTATYEPSPVPKPVIAFFAACRKILGKAEVKRETLHNPPAVSHRGTWELQICVEPDPIDGGFIAECLDVPGAMSQGETEEEALENVIDAIQGVLAARMEEHFKSIDFEMPPIGTEKRGRILRVTF
jgi:predicted RNase H-like HicB family nuclease